MIKKISLFSIVSLLIISCKDDSSSSIKKQETEDNIVENVVNSDKVLGSFSSKRYGNDLVEEIYQEILINDKTLSKLDNKIKDLNENTNTVIEEYNTVLSKSSSYYNTALSKTAQFRDSIFAKKIDSLITKSEIAYTTKTLPVQTIIDSAKANQHRINDLYTAFKIKKTLTEIEKYQNTNTFDLNNINNAVKAQTQLVEDIKNITNK